MDIPSGLYADNGFVENTAIKADCTITFSCLKYCLSLYPAKKYAGKIKFSKNYMLGLYGWSNFKLAVLGIERGETVSNWHGRDLKKLFVKTGLMS